MALEQLWAGCVAGIDLNSLGEAMNSVSTSSLWRKSLLLSRPLLQMRKLRHSGEVW